MATSPAEVPAVLRRGKRIMDDDHSWGPSEEQQGEEQQGGLKRINKCVAVGLNQEPRQPDVLAPTKEDIESLLENLCFSRTIRYSKLEGKDMNTVTFN